MKNNLIHFYENEYLYPHKFHGDRQLNDQVL